MSSTWKAAALGALVASTVGITGCCHYKAWGRPQACDPCQTGPACGCEPQVACEPCQNCESCGKTGCWDRFCLHCSAKLHRRSGAIPDTLPLGSVVRSHYQVMETNGEAVDFILNQNDFVGETAELTPDGKDKVMEIAARMKAHPFPVVVERTWNNADPELDAVRRNLVAQILTDFGNSDAQQRTVVSTPYGPGYWSSEAEGTYYLHNFHGRGGGNFGGASGGFGGGSAGGTGMY